MACSDPFGRVAAADVTLTLSSSTLTFSVTATGDNLYQFRLRDLIVIAACNNEGVMLRDGMSTITISNATLTALGSSSAAIQAATSAARGSVDVDGALLRTTTSGTIAAGAYAYSISNVGANAGVYDGQVFDAGLSVSWPALANSGTYESKTYDATNTIFVIAESR